MISGCFVTATGTSAGKTWMARGLARALVRSGRPVAALKPIETGCTPDPSDAVALARACAQPALAFAPGLYRAPQPLAPHAVWLETGAPPPDLVPLARLTHTLAGDGEFVLVEGAGGLLTPVDAAHTLADFALALALPLVLVAPDALGVISHVLTAIESARARRLRVIAVVLCTHGTSADDPSRRTNRHILGERLQVPVLAFERCPDADDALADAAERCGLLALFDPR